MENHDGCGARLKLVAKRLAGIAFGGLGTVLLTVALEQILDPEPPGDLLTQASAAGITGAIFLTAGILLTAITAASAKRGEKFDTGKMVATLIAAPTGIALSLAVSLVTAAGAATLFAAGAGWAVATFGAILIAGGYFIDRGFWWKLVKGLVEALKSPDDNPNSSPGDAGTDPAPAQF